MEPIVTVREMTKRYGPLTAVDGVSFDVAPGEIFGIIGPNGAGKTTVVESLLGLRAPDAGTLRVLGHDPMTGGAALRARIGAQLQAAALPDRLKVHEALELFAALYEEAEDPAALIEKWGLTERRNAAFGDLSGGQKQRLFVALALVNKPELVILDELTTGLDPQARRATWELVRSVRERGATVILVTHFMDEAEALCDRIAVVAGGKIRALDAPAKLVASLRSAAVVRFTRPAGYTDAMLDGVPGLAQLSHKESEIVVTGSGPLLVHVAARLVALPEPPLDLRAERSTLEDVFLSLTGSEVRD